MRPTDADDMKYLYAAWRLGGEGPLSVIEADNTPEAFTAAFADHASSRFQTAYTMLATPPNKPNMPVGVVFGIMPFYQQPIMWFGDFLWFPWASKRNKLEASVHFLNQMRKSYAMIGFCEQDAIRFFEHICRYGVLRRAGTVFDMFEDGPRGVFQTRKPYMMGKN